MIIELFIKQKETKDLSVNQIAERINMTRQGVRWHINKLEKESRIFRKEIDKRNIVYSYRWVIR